MTLPLVLNEHRCNCGKLLFKGDFKGHIEIKCLRCGQIRDLYGPEERDCRVGNK